MSRLTTESGAPVADNQNSQTAGPGGPVLLQDQHLLEKLARFNRERIPERVVHAVGSGAYGHFEVTNPDVSRWNMPELGWYWGYPFALGVMMLCAAVMVFYFWKKGWFR